MLDTNICIFIMKHSESVLKQFLSKLPAEIAISAITHAELEFGVANSVARDKNKVSLIKFLNLTEIVPFDSSAATEFGEIRASLQKMGKPIGAYDMLIAAHAKSIGATLVTNNTREFRRVKGLAIEDWLSA
jgi:tRNA(fMet)-specific endonuclease VapC